jgi:hypothetical protein
MPEQKKKTPARRSSKRNYAEDRKSWYKKVTLEELIDEYEREGDAAALAAVERAKKERKKVAGD